MRQKLLIFIVFISFFICSYRYEDVTNVLDAKNNAVNHNNMGLAYMEWQQYAQAEAEFKIAISLVKDSPARAAYFNNLGLLYLKLNNFALATDCFCKAIDLNPVFLEYYKNLVSLYEQEGSIDEYKAIYNSQVNANASNSNAQLLLGLIYLQKDDKANAVICFEKFLAIEKYNYLSKAVKKLLNDIKSEN